MKKRIAGILLIVILMLNTMNISVFAMETPDELKNLYAQSAVLMDADSGRILFGKNETDMRPMASTTKIMTCILALENMENNQICTVSKYAAKQPKVRLGVQEGDQFYLKDLLYSLMLESHNDSAVVIAETIGGTVEKFADMMNQKSIDIGCNSTYFITPNGLDAEDETGIHSTTASDLALIMRYCISKSPKCYEFLEITRESSYKFSDLSGKKEYSCSNHNAFLTMMDGALSGKTGFTNNAGYCYVGALKRGERTFIIALLACGWPNNKGYKWIDTRKLMEYALKNYEYRNVDEVTEVFPVLVTGGYDRNHPFDKNIYVKTKIQNGETKCRFLLHKKETIGTKIICQEKISAPIQKGQKIGSIYYMLNEEILKTDNIVTEEDVYDRNMRNCFGILFARLLLKDLTE